MKLIHLSDLHLGKRLDEVSFFEDQQYVLAQILEIIDEEKPQGVLISGDIYDKSAPSAEAMSLFDEFLYKISQRDIDAYIISGNHDSADRLAYANRIMSKSGIHISNRFSGKMEKYEASDEFGKLNIYMLPFVKPVMVREYCDAEIVTCTDAVMEVIKAEKVNTAERNVLLAHQYVIGAQRSDSEEMIIGGADSVEERAFEDFDYVALGHIHRPQNVSERIRYCGTPLKYSFSEHRDEKSVTIVELREKGDLKISTRALKPMRDLIQLEGSFEQVTEPEFYEGKNYEEAYVKIVLTDEDFVPDAMNKLRKIYHNILSLDYDNIRSRHNTKIMASSDIENKDTSEYFVELFEAQNNKPMNERQEEIVSQLLAEIRGQ